MNIEHAYILYVDDVNSIAYAEECKRSCEQYNLPYTMVKWYKPPITTKYILDTYYYYLNPRLDYPANIIHLKEAMCSTGHMYIWSLIMHEHKGAAAIFEHDAILKRDIKSIDVEDNEILYLGYRVDSADDYKCVDDDYVKLDTNEFCGTHAYAITPATARFLLNRVQLKHQFAKLCDNCQCDSMYLPICSVDWWLSHNMLGLEKMTIIDPSPVVAVVGGRKSYTQHHEQVAKFNVPSVNGFPPKFLQGLTSKDKYFVDDQNYLRFR